MARRLKVFYLAVDPATPIDRRPRAGLMQGREILIDGDELLGDGPSSSRVTVVDLDAADGSVFPGAKLIPEGPRRSMATHMVADRSDISARDFQQVSVFGAVRTTMDLFESQGILGRRLDWGFDGDQITVVPRAGEKANAFYERESRSLKFFYFEGVIGEENTTVYTCLSPDIVAHETAHAILDGIAPDLYDATAPQSLGLHEAVADITSMLFAAGSARLRELVLKQNRGKLRQPGAFNAIAEQFGRARSGRIQPLRDLLNKKTMSTTRSVSPHDLSEVLTGALYEVFLRSYEAELDEAVEGIGDTPANRYSQSGRTLASVSRRFARIALRALDYLPPGEVSFADYVRAVVAADSASNPESPQERDFLIAEAIRRGILDGLEDAAPLPCRIDLGAVDLSALVEDDATARKFAEAHRDELLVPLDADFDVRPRRDVTKETIRRGNVRTVTRELIFKVTWARRETVPDAMGLPIEVEVRHGSTLAIDWETRAARALLTTNSAMHATGDRAAHGEMRSKWLSMMLDEGHLSLSKDARQLSDGSYSFRGLARQLHIAGR